MTAARLIALGLLVVACDPSGPPPSGPGPGSSSGATPGTSGGEASTSGGTAGADSTGPGPGSTGGSTGPAPATFGGTFPEYCPPGVDPSLEIGLGDVEYRPIDAEVAQLVMGHQGGHHVVLGLRGQGLDLADWGSGYMHATIGGAVVADYDTIVVMECDEGGEFSEALWLNLIFDAPPEDLVGQTAEVLVEFTDASEVTVGASATVQISEDIVHQ